MIARVFHGYTSNQNADVYENLLINEIFVAIANKKLYGYNGVQLLRRNLETEIEFTVIMLFDNIDSVKQFAGEDYEKSYVPEKAREVLLRFDEKATHHELRHASEYAV